MCHPKPETSYAKAGLCFIRNCVQQKTGLVRRWETDPWTTPYANALAAMALIHDHDLGTAARIFQTFQRYYQAHADDFNSLPQSWNVETGQPEPGSIHWESDAAFLLLALLAFQKSNGNASSYGDLLTGLKNWLWRRSACASVIVAEGVAVMYAALAPFRDEITMQERLNQLKAYFFSDDRICSRDYPHYLSHAIRAAMIFGDVSGLAFVKNFIRTETWGYDNTTQISACSAYADESAINVEISAQFLLAVHLLKLDSLLAELPLQDELAKLWLQSSANPQAIGIPASIAHRPGKPLFRLPALEPTCYILFDSWDWNLFQENN